MHSFVLRYSHSSISSQIWRFLFILKPEKISQNLTRLCTLNVPGWQMHLIPVLVSAQSAFGPHLRRTAFVLHLLPELKILFWMENLSKIKGSTRSGSGPPDPNIDPCIKPADLDPTSELMLKHVNISIWKLSYRKNLTEKYDWNLDWNLNKYSIFVFWNLESSWFGLENSSHARSVKNCATDSNDWI